MGDVSDGRSVVITDIRMPFWSMVVFMVKWAIAAIPALLILTSLAYMIVVGVPSVISGYAAYELKAAAAEKDAARVAEQMKKDQDALAKKNDRTMGGCIARGVESFEKSGLSRNAHMSDGSPDGTTVEGFVQKTCEKDLGSFQG